MESNPSGSKANETGNEHLKQRAAQSELPNFTTYLVKASWKKKEKEYLPYINILLFWLQDFIGLSSGLIRFSFKDGA